jgi:tripartite-type tricarboxylate transporter receptor subunit TctC
MAMVSAQPAWPSKPVRLIVPTVPGGSIDILARLLAQHLEPLWGQSVMVEYKPGAGTVIGTDYVAKSAPDGYTLGIVVTAHVINPNLRPKMPFDTLRDLAGVTMTTIGNLAVVANPSFEANSLPQLITLAKASPNKIAYASPGTGTSLHLAGELLKAMAGIELVHVPYKGGAPAFIDVIAGRVPLFIVPHYLATPYVNAGKLKMIAVTGAKRARTAPDTATVSETIPGFNVQGFDGLVVPSATPRQVVAKLNADLVRVLNLPNLRARMDEYDLEVVGSKPEQFDAFIRAEIDNWAKAVKSSGVTLD